MHHLPLLGEPAEPVPAESVSSGRRVQGVTADGSMWIHCLVQYADALLNKPKHVQSALPFSAEQRTAWDGYRPPQSRGPPYRPLGPIQ